MGGPVSEGIEQVHQCIAGRLRNPEPRSRALDYPLGLLITVVVLTNRFPMWEL